MNMKNFENFHHHLILATLFFSLTACVKQKEHISSSNYLELARLELADGATQHTQRRALALLDKALAEKKDMKSLALKGTILFNLGHASEAKAAYDEALCLEGTSALSCDIKNNYACLLATLGEGVRACEIWNELATQPYYLTPEVALYNMGRYHLSIGKAERAEECFVKALDLDGSYIDAHLALALLVFDNEERQHEAFEHLSAVLFLEPGNQVASLLTKRIGGQS